MKHTHTFALVLIACAALMLPVRLSGQQAADRASMLTVQMDSVWHEGKFAEALGLAKELLALRRATPSSKPFEVVDARRWASSLEFIVALPPATQAELLEAYRWFGEIEKLYQDAKYDECVSGSEKQLRVFKKVLAPADPDIAKCLGNLAVLSYAKGDYAGAERFCRESLAIERKALGPDHPEVATGLDNLAQFIMEKGDYAGAESLCREALEIRRKALGPDHPDVATGLNNLAGLLESKGDYAGAEPLYRESLEIGRKALGPDHPEVATTLNNLGVLLSKKGDYAEAERFYREALEIRRHALGPDHPYVATTLNNLALLLKDKGDYEGAEPLSREAIEISRKALGPDHPEVAINLCNLASVLQAKGDYAGAEPLYRESLGIFLKALGPDHPNVATNLNNLAHVLQKNGDYAGAEPLFRESLEIRRKILGPDHPALATSLNNLALLLEAKGDYLAAEPLHREALGIRRKALGPDHPEVAASLHNLACLLEKKGDYAGAEPLLRDALEISRKALGPDHPDVATILSNLAILLDDKGDMAGAEPLCREALGIRRKALGPDHPDVATSLNNLANLLRANRDYAGAEPLFREALEINRKAFGPDHPSVALSLYNLALLLEDTGDHAGAERELSRAAEVFDVCRQRIGPGIERVAFQTSPYPVLAFVRLEIGKTNEAWPAVERDLGRALMDLLVAAESRPLAPSEFAQEDSLKRAMDNLEREVTMYQEASVKDTTGKTSEGLDEARDRLIAAEAEWAKFQGELARKYPVNEGQPYPLDMVQKSLDRETAILGWLDVEKGKKSWVSWAYLIRQRGPVVWAHIGAPSDSSKGSPFDRMRAYRDLLGSSGAVRLGTAGPIRAGGERWSERLVPLAKSLKGIKHLVVIPSGAMLGVPVEALVDDRGEYLADRYDISYSPSATIYAWLKERSKEQRLDRPTRSLLVGDPPFQENQLAAMEQGADMESACIGQSEPSMNVVAARYVLARNTDALASLNRLPCTRMEVETIARMLQRPKILVGPDASEQALAGMAETGELKEFKVLHFATHGFVDDERSERSALILSQVNIPDPLEAAMAGTRIYDGLVSAKEIVREWKLDADLVTLSACETGLGKVVGGEGYVGFAHAFLQAGARSLLVSLWKVEDRATSLLMQRFYDNWTGAYEDTRHGRKGEAMSKAEALQEAKQYLRTFTDQNGERPFEHPYFWSAFILIGDRN